MTIWDQVFTFLTDQWPALLVLLYGYLQGKTIRAEQQVKADALAKSIQEAHDKIDQANLSKSSFDIVTQVANGPGSKLN